MNIILFGARGFIGSYIARALKKAGHNLIYGVHKHLNNHGNTTKQEQDRCVFCDFSVDIKASTWVKRLQDIQQQNSCSIDMVINTVGILRDSKQKPMHAIHTQTPCAIFDACAEIGIKHIIHLSALGIEHSDTLYATTKKMADTHLLKLTQNDNSYKNTLKATILRPSVVFGSGGDSSKLFVNLSKLPILLLPKAMITKHIQPISALDLAQAVQNICEIYSKIIQANSADNLDNVNIEYVKNKIIECIGPEALTLAQFIATLREQSGKKSHKLIGMPDWLTQFSAKMGDYIPNIPWCTEALNLLNSQNTSTSNTFAKILGRSPMHYHEFLAQYN